MDVRAPHGRRGRRGRQLGVAERVAGAKDVLLYVRPTTLRATANGYAVLTRRRDVQRVLSDFFAFCTRLIARYRARELYPLNLPIEVRVTGLDRPGDVGVDGARPALLSRAGRSAHELADRRAGPSRTAVGWSTGSPGTSWS
jgi:hypothetical protein